MTSRKGQRNRTIAITDEGRRWLRMYELGLVTTYKEDECRNGHTELTPRGCRACKREWKRKQGTKAS